MREWYVVRLGRPANAAKAHLVAANVQQVIDGAPNQWAQAEQIQPAPRRAAPRNARNVVEEFLEGQEQQQPRVQARPAGHGYWVTQVRDDTSGLIAFTTEEAAKTYATEQAGKNPKVMYGVFGCTSVFETTEPVVVVKQYNDSGELIIQQEGTENA